jgi:L-alanine-DL-glutamate epimerase-like enolase superfamily enzyme
MQIQNGHIQVPQGHGLGIELNEEILKKYAL